jgi:hypothetical protein
MGPSAFAILSSGVGISGVCVAFGAPTGPAAGGCTRVGVGSAIDAGSGADADVLGEGVSCRTSAGTGSAGAEEKRALTFPAKNPRRSGAPGALIRFQEMHSLE